MNVLVVVNDQPDGSERPCNALQLANAPSKSDDVEVRVFPLGDASAVAGQQLPEGYYDRDRMLKGRLSRAQVGSCVTYLDAGGFSGADARRRRRTLNALGADRMDAVNEQGARVLTSPSGMSERAGSTKRVAAWVGGATAAFVACRGEVSA
jgi:uncharacterized protein involved in oxidation of intracellular sulfur